MTSHFFPTCCCCCLCPQALHARCGELKAEIRALMLSHGVKAMRLVPVKRSYAFEDPVIPSREQWVIKVGACSSAQQQQQQQAQMWLYNLVQH
jgi:hypothetical protein